MKTHRYLKFLPLLALAFASQPSFAADQRPNVLYVIADMERAYSMGCYGDTNARTPHFDALSKQGLRLNAAISTTPVCCPYRAGLMSGQYAHHNGMMSNGAKFLPTVKCLGETFRDAGYETGYVGKWHLGTADKPTDPTWGFPAPGTEYGVYHFKRSPAPTTALGLKFIAEKSKGTAPWMLFVSWIWPHSPYSAPAENLAHFTNVSILPNVPAGKPHDFAAKSLPDYYGMIEAVDAQFGQLMAALEKAGVADNTIVIFSSDHGDMIGSQGYKAKRWPYEESARVPFLIRYPKKLKAGRVIEEPFGTPDIYPTLASLAGLSAPAGIDGADFSQFLLGSAEKPPRDFVYMEMAYAFVPWPGWRAIRTKDTMYARLVDKPWLMFDLNKDPLEMHNLVGSAAPSEAVTAMDNRLASAMKQYGDSWTAKINVGDVESWVPGGPKQRTQSLGVPYPGEAKIKGGKRKAAKAAKDDGDQ